MFTGSFCDKSERCESLWINALQHLLMWKTFKN